MLKTAEATTPMHPDKMCDRISDALLDICLQRDPNARTAIETMGGHGIVNITGEINAETGMMSTEFNDLIEKTVHRITKDDSLEVNTNIVVQSPEIAQGVDTGGAGDQGIMVGYANNFNEAKIPNELFYARRLAKFLYSRYPEDGKTQVTLSGENEFDTIVASFANVSQEELHKSVREWLTMMTNLKAEPKIHCNPAGDWKISGFEADAGLTGRKLACDNYGTSIPLGGGCFSGKDGTKVDRSGAYMARYLAVFILDKLYPSDQKKKAEVIVKVAYAIGVAKPVMVTVQCREPFSENDRWAIVDIRELFDTSVFAPAKIIDFLELRKPQFEKVAEWGSFGNGLKWDKIVDDDQEN